MDQGLGHTPQGGQDQAPSAGALRRARTARSDASPPRRESAGAVVRRVLRADIVNMVRKPGDPISEKSLAAAFGVSRTPVREALLALAEEGLVDIFPQSGTFVARIPLNGMPEAMLIRESLETTIVRLAAEKAGPNDFASLTRALDAQRAVLHSGVPADFHQLDEDFHARIAAIAGYPGVWSLVQQVKYQIDRFRLMTLTISARTQTVLGEHAAIAEAIGRNDCDAAAAAMMLHLSGARAGLDVARALNPSYFSGGDTSPQ